MPTSALSTDIIPDTYWNLHQLTLDICAGFETMVSKAEPEFRPVAERFLALHRDHHARLHEMLPHHHEGAEDEGVMGKINKAVVTVRSWFDEIDDDVMGQVRSGEQYLLDAFDDAIGDALEPEHAAKLRTMRGELAELLERSERME